MIKKIINKEQREAIESNNDPMMIIAGAGSGKTFVLTKRIIYLVEELGYYHNSILAFTFTNKAASEIKERILSSIPELSFYWIGTFHSICLKILREDISIIGRSNNFIIIDEEDQLSIIKEIYSKYGINKDIIIPKKVYFYISILKTKKIDSNNYEDINNELDKYGLENEKKEIISKCYLEYSKCLLERNLLDFDDLIISVNKIFSVNEEAKIKWQNKFNYILVDEFQDTNEDQFELLNYLIKDKQNIFIVGDPDQMIYSWRGAYSNIFDDFQNLYPHHKKILLEKNYRSTQNILDISNNLIKNNKFRIKKNLYTDNSIGSNIIYYDAASSDRESLWISNKILSLKNLGYSYNDIAILYRSNYLSRNIEQSLIFKDIPYVIFGGLKFFQRKEIKDIISFLKLICFDDDVSLNRIYNTPKRKISESTYSKILKYAADNNISTLNAFENSSKIEGLKNTSIKNCENFITLIKELKEYKFITINELIDKVLKETKYLEYLKDIDEEYRNDNIKELKNAINLYQHKNPKSSLMQYLQEITLYTDNEEKNSKDFKREYVSLMTVHNSKGLEFKNVFIISFCDGLFPTTKSLESGDVSEERRIAYVAMTRAKENLFISSFNGKSFHYSDSHNLLPSRFLGEISSSNNFESIIDNAINVKNKNVNNKKIYELKETKDFSNNYHDTKQTFDLGDIINHISFGQGVIVGIENDTLKIVFKSPYGTKFISRDHKSIKKIPN